MNKIVILIACFFALTNALKRIPIKLEESQLDYHWSKFKLKHGKKYMNLIHETSRKIEFNNSITKINELNKLYNEGKISYISGINKFSDWSSEEFLAYVNKGVTIKKSKKIYNYKKLGIKLIDWRRKGAVNEIKDQDKCGSSSWAFGSLSAIESHIAINFNVLPNLSEQNLIDCVYDDHDDACEATGNSENAFDYIKRNGGINDNYNYPYTSGSTETWSGRCNYKKRYDSGFQVTDFVILPENDEEALQEAISNIGPVVTTFEVTDNFQHYKSGVFSDETCASYGNKVNHFVLIVGLGKDRNSGKDYYIIRNSWGTKHGINGYYYFERNINKSMCGIAYLPLYPIVDKSQPDHQMLNSQDQILTGQWLIDNKHDFRNYDNTEFWYEYNDNKIFATFKFVKIVDNTHLIIFDKSRDMYIRISNMEMFWGVGKIDDIPYFIYSGTWITKPF